MNIRYRLVCVLSVFLVACQGVLPLNPAVEVYNSPEPLALEDDSGNVLGYGVPLYENVFVAPDHLWQVSEALYFNDEAIEVLARDFRHDLLFFTLSRSVINNLPTWSTEPPGVGQTLTWGTAENAKSANVFSAKAEFVLGTVEVEDLMQLSVVTQPGSSGKALYDASNNKVYGMLVASDSFNDVSYFVRSDVILNLAQEYLEDV